MILGVGIDTLETDRMRRELAKEDGGLRDTVFTAGEVSDCERTAHPAAHFAARFAAKEAVIKALGGIREKDAAWRDLEVRDGPDGLPRVLLHGSAGRLAEDRGIRRIRLSLAIGEDLATALVVLES
jgi:holo-[acyl-carrier protein] synthase